MSFQGVDFFELDSLYSEEELMIRDSVRDFVDSDVMPIIEQHYLDGTFPSELTKKMADIGLFGIKTNEKYGGAGAGYSQDYAARHGRQKPVNHR